MTYRDPRDGPAFAPLRKRPLTAAPSTGLAGSGSPEEAKAAARAAAVACLPSLPAPMVVKAVVAIAPTEVPPPEHTLSSVAPTDAGRLARRLAMLAGSTNLPPGAEAGRLAARLAGEGAARLEEL